MRKPNTAKVPPETNDLRQRAVQARDAAGRFIRRHATAESSAAVADPALAAIEAHRSAFVEYERLASVANDLPPTEPRYRAASLAAEGPGRREIATYEALFRAKPTTLDGTLSLASYLCEAVRTAQIDDKPSDGERALRAITEALQGLASASGYPPHPDAVLFALGAEFVAAWTVEEETTNGAGYRACNRLADRIVQTPAVTAAGLGIKALLLARLDEDGSSPRTPAKAQGPIASHWNVLRQVQEGAARLADATDMGIPISAADKAETGLPAAANAPAGPNLVGLLDLASAPWDDLRSVRDLADHVGTFAYSLAWTDRCRARWLGAPSDHYNAAGKLMQWLGEALTDVEEAAEREAERRVARGSRDGETRLAMLAVRVIENGDPEQTKAFAHELLDHAIAEGRGY